MIFVGNINEINVEDYDEVWICMRSIKSIHSSITSKENVKHIPELSPSEELFFWTQDKKKKYEWTEELFKNEYASRFLKEMNEIEAQKKLLFLKNIEYNNPRYKICLCCSCNIEKLCHRYLLANILNHNGINVKKG